MKTSAKSDPSLVNKQLFFDPKLAQTTCFPYITKEVQYINIKLSENNRLLERPENT